MIITLKEVLGNQIRNKFIRFWLQATLHWRYVGGQINKFQLQLSIIFCSGWTLLI